VVSSLGKPFTQALDGENNAIEFDVAYPLSGELVHAVNELRRRHGEDICLLPLSGMSCGGGIFQAGKRPAGTVVGLRFDPPSNPRIRFTDRLRLAELGLDEIVIDPRRQQISAGSSVTLDQLNQALAQQLGPQFKVPGADLTSYRYAAVGATFMTGGMGPQRRYFSDSVIAAAIFDGETLRQISGGVLAGYAGTYGWSGIVSALSCRYYRFPDNEIAFALPVVNRPLEIAQLLERLAPYTDLKLDRTGVNSGAGRQDLILGLEQVSVGSMQPLLRDNSASPIAEKARELRQNCQLAGADSLVFVNGYSNRPIDEFLLELATETDDGEFSIAGIELEHAGVFPDPEAMRAVREAIPYAARMQTPTGGLVYKNHSDANIRMPAANLGDTVRQLWRIELDYVAAVERYFDSTTDIDGEILVYGHLNPYGIDPHNRVTLSSDHEIAFRQAREFLITERARFYRALAALCRDNDAIFVGGEKTADSEIAIFTALGGAQNAPAALYRRFQQQRACIAKAAHMFSWRALPPYI